MLPVVKTPTDFPFTHTGQPDKLGQSLGGDFADVQDKFDSRAIFNQNQINAIITALNSIADGDSGADNIGMTPISGLSATNPQEALEELALKSPINVADNSITNLKLATDVKVGSLTALLTTIKTSVVGAINELFNDKLGKTEKAADSQLLDGKDSTEFCLKGAPAEIEITSGFSSGISSGKIFYSKTQENQLNIAIDKFITTSDITTSYTLAYTLPITPTNYRPKHTQRLIGTGFTIGGAHIAGTLIEVLIDTDGTINIKSILGTTTNLRYVGGLQTTVLGV